MLSLVVSVVFLVVYISPLRWVAMYADAEETSYRACFILSIIYTLIQLGIGILFPGVFLVTIIISAIISVIVCMRVLKIPTEKFFAFSLMLLLFNMVVNYATVLVINGVLRTV